MPYATTCRPEVVSATAPAASGNGGLNLTLPAAPSGVVVDAPVTLTGGTPKKRPAESAAAPRVGAARALAAVVAVAALAAVL
jgi:hypothetical protein